MAVCERRGMQGNIQYLHMLGASGVHRVSRLYLLISAWAYLTSPVWLLLIGKVETQGSRGFVTMAPPSVLALTVVLLFGTKLIRTKWMLADRERRRSCGGAGAILRTVPVEIVLGMLLAPITMVTQTKALTGLLFGISAGWNTQSRDAWCITVRGVLPDLRDHLLMGAALAATAFSDTPTVLWLSLIIAVLFVSPWLINLSSSKALGSRAAAARFFRVPEPGITESPRITRDGGKEAN